LTRWEKRLDGQGRPYYVDHVNKKSTRDDPRTAQAAPPQQAAQPAAQPTQAPANTGTPVSLAPGEEPLPPGYGLITILEAPPIADLLGCRWEKRLDGQGRPYFVDHVNKKSTRDDPRAAKV